MMKIKENVIMTKMMPMTNDNDNDNFITMTI